VVAKCKGPTMTGAAEGDLWNIEYNLEKTKCRLVQGYGQSIQAGNICAVTLGGAKKGSKKGSVDETPRTRVSK